MASEGQSRFAAAFGVLAALAACAAASAAPEAEPGKGPAAGAAAAAGASDKLLAFYPAKARADGVEGQVILKCGRNAHLALAGCQVASEIPAGEGFGAAALAMAAEARDNPAIDIPDLTKRPPGVIQLRFRLRPTPSISPDITGVAHLLTPPRIVTKPTDAQIAAAYPERALNDQIEGGAIIDCHVTLEGQLAACRLLREQPAGYGFGQAALDLAPDFKMKPGEYDNQPIANGEAPIVIPFRTTDPSAPLTLDLAKPKPKGREAPQ